MPDQKASLSFVTNDIGVGFLKIEKDTSSAYPGTVFDFFVKTNFEISVSPG
jgi:hypothetical protein